MTAPVLSSRLSLENLLHYNADSLIGVASFPSDDKRQRMSGRQRKRAIIPNFPNLPLMFTNVWSKPAYTMTKTVLDCESALQASLGPETKLVASAGGFSQLLSTVPLVSKNPP